MKSSSVSSRAGATILLLTVTSLTVFIVSTRSRKWAVPGHGGIPEETTATPVLADPIYTEATAIARSLNHFPADHTHTAVVARRLSRLSAMQWLNGPYAASWSTELSEGRAVATSDPPEDLTVPCWLVGIQGSGLVVNDVIDIPGGVQDSSPVEGKFFLWNANSGEMLVAGALDPSTWTTFAAISEITNAPIPISPMTPVIIYVDATPFPTNTFTAIQWATMDTLETIAASTPIP